jgi:hypothetical protein
MYKPHDVTRLFLYEPTEDLVPTPSITQTVTEGRGFSKTKITPTESGARTALDMVIPRSNQNLMKSVILRITIGDGNLKNREKTEGANPLLSISHGDMHLPLALQTARILGSGITTTLTSYERSRGRVQHEVTTCRHRVLKEVRSLTYELKGKNSKRVLVWEKVLPKNFETLLN